MADEYVIQTNKNRGNEDEQNLPINDKRDEIVQKALKNQVCLIRCESGSGKSTQLPKLLLQSPVCENGRIVCTQPRKGAVASLAAKVASEMKQTVGDVVGYQCGVQRKISEKTKLVYMTDLALLNHFLQDELLNEYVCIIIDEAQERSIYTDILLGMIKNLLPKRKDQRICLVIVTSTFTDSKVFVDYYDECPVITVSDAVNHVDIEWIPRTEEENYENVERKAVDKVVEIHSMQPVNDGDIILFLPGQPEIERYMQTLQKKLKDKSDHWILPLHNKLQSIKLNEIFEKTPPKKRKIVISTNMAEAYDTIPGLRYILDTGFVKEIQYDPVKKEHSLKLIQITQSSANQRKEIARKSSQGKCFRFYSQNDLNMTTIPDILRIHIGHAVLKLLQLGVNPCSFDFVQSPLTKTIETTFQELSKLEAVKDGKLTELGNWIAKLPLDPNLGVFVHDAVERDIGVEAIIIATTSTFSVNLFYRGGSIQQRDECEKLKIPFCHNKGDHLSFLNVFKQWLVVPEEEKVEWCIKNSINDRTMRNIQDTVLDILYILEKEMDISLKLELKHKICDERALRELLFKAFQQNLGYYLGHEKVGYYFVDKDKDMLIHPSSSLRCLAIHPKWVISEMVLNTSRTYAVNITEVDEKDVMKALERKELTFKIEDIRQKRLREEPIHIEYVGHHLLNQIVGPDGGNVQEIERKLQKDNKNVTFVVEADKEKGEILIYASSEKNEISVGSLKMVFDPMRKKIKDEQVIKPIASKCNAANLSIGPGGIIQDIMFDYDFRSVSVYCSDKNFKGVEQLRKRLGKFGEIIDFVEKSPSNSHPKYRGEAVFKESDSAKNAVAGTSDKESEIKVKPPFWMSDQFKVKLKWCRRVLEGYGLVQVKNEVAFKAVLALSEKKSFPLGESSVSIKESGRMNEFCISGITEPVNEDILKEWTVGTLRLSENDIEKVYVPRKTPSNLETLYHLKSKLEEQIGKYADKKKFMVTLPQVSPKEIYYNGYVTFIGLEDGTEAYLSFHDKIKINGRLVSFTPDVRFRMFVQDCVVQHVGAKFNEFVEKANNGRDTIRIEKKLHGNYIIDINTESVKKMLELRNSLQFLFKAEILDLMDMPRLGSMFTRNGKNKIDEIMKKTNTLIVCNNRNKTISIYGEGRYHLVKDEIETYIDSLGSSKTIDLKGESKHSGLIKRLIQDLQGLRDQTDLAYAKLDHRKHRIEIQGSEEAIELAEKSIKEIMKVEEMRNYCKAPSKNAECGICFTEMSTTELYRLESCGHPCCKNCIQSYLSIKMKEKDFPLQCCHEFCNMLWAWSDIQNMIKLGFCTLQFLIDASVSYHVAKHKDKLRYCITPECKMVYEVCTDGKSKSICPLCGISLCRRCHVEYHAGVSCEIYQHYRGINDELKKWICDDPSNRGLCPKCCIPIEKNGGCMHVECKQCGSHICWTCEDFFDSRSQCYKHLLETHKSYV